MGEGGRWEKRLKVFCNWTNEKNSLFCKAKGEENGRQTLFSDLEL